MGLVASVFTERLIEVAEADLRARYQNVDVTYDAQARAAALQNIAERRAAAESPRSPPCSSCGGRATTSRSAPVPLRWSFSASKPSASPASRLAGRSFAVPRTSRLARSPPSASATSRNPHPRGSDPSFCSRARRWRLARLRAVARALPPPMTPPRTFTEPFPARRGGDPSDLLVHAAPGEQAVSHKRCGGLEVKDEVWICNDGGSRHGRVASDVRPRPGRT